MKNHQKSGRLVLLLTILDSKWTQKDCGGSLFFHVSFHCSFHCCEEKKVPGDLPSSTAPPPRTLHGTP